MSIVLNESPSLHTAGFLLLKIENLIHFVSINDYELLKHCLDRIDSQLPLHWPELLESISKLRKLAYNIEFPCHKKAALIASKIYFYASDLDNALEFALLADELFDPYFSLEYNEAIMCNYYIKKVKCIEKFIEIRKSNTPNDLIPPRLQAILDELFSDTIEKGHYKQAVDIALETQSLNLLEHAILASGKDPHLLSYCVDCSGCSYDNLDFRPEVIQKLLELYGAQDNKALIGVAKYLFMIADHEKLFDILKRLIYAEAATDGDLAAAFQICFDLYDNCLQNHLGHLINNLNTEASLRTAELVTSGFINVSSDVKDGAFLTKSGENYLKLPHLANLQRMISILDGTEPNRLRLEFMIRSLKYDTRVLVDMQKSSAFPTSHTATAVCNAFVHLGTASDALIRSNVEWLSFSFGWGRFIMVASLGLLYKGHGSAAFRILKPYLPGFVKDHFSPHQEGGALYAIGLAYANYGMSVINRFKPYLTVSTNNIVAHGACLGVGLAAIGSHNEELFNNLLTILKLDDAISGKAAAIACGLVMLASNNISHFNTLKDIISTTQHEKIQRGLALALAMILAEMSSAANNYIESMISDYHPAIRMAGVYSVATAYAGTNDPFAVKLLWRTACSDSNVDVQRVSMIALGLVMYKEPEQLLGIALLFVQTHNPHLRCGALLALGIAFSGSSDDKISTLIKSLFKDSALVVRQTAYIACAMVLVQKNEKTSENYRLLRTIITSLCTDRRSDTIAKFGAYLAYGILDAGGRNVTLSFTNAEGRTRPQSVAGFLIFQLFWFWFPLVHFLSLCFSPTCIIIVNPSLETPAVSFECHADLSLFASPFTSESSFRDPNEQIRHISHSHNFKTRGKKRSSKDQERVQLTSLRGSYKKNRSHLPTQKITEKSVSSDVPILKTVSKLEAHANSQKEKKGHDRNDDAAYRLVNPVRALPNQLQYMHISSPSSLETVKEISYGGIIVCYGDKSSKDNEAVTTVDPSNPTLPASQSTSKH